METWWCIFAIRQSLEGREEILVTCQCYMFFDSAVDPEHEQDSAGQNKQCCGTVMIYCGSGSGSESRHYRYLAQFSNNKIKTLLFQCKKQHYSNSKNVGLSFTFFLLFKLFFMLDSDPSSVPEPDPAPEP
jgi:hypothetical protein